MAGPEPPGPGGDQRVEACAQPLAEHAGKRRRARHPGEKAGVVAVLHVGKRGVDQRLHRLERIARLLRHRAAQRGHQRVR